MDGEYESMTELDYASSEAKPHKRRKRFSLFKVLVCVILVVIIAIAGIGLRYSTDIRETLYGIFSSSSSEFTYSVNADSVISLTAHKNGFLVLTNTLAAYVDSSGDVIGSATLSYSSPRADVAGKWSIVFDRSGTSYHLAKNGRSTGENTTDAEIINCAVASNGYYAVVTQSEDSNAILYVYSSSGSLKFAVSFATSYVVDVALYNRSKAAVVSVNTVDGDLYSYITIYDYGYSEPYCTFELEDTVVACKYFTSSKLLVVGKSGVYYIDDNVLTTVCTFTSDTLEYSSFTDNGLVTVSVSDTDSSVSDVRIISKKGEITSSFTVSGTITAFDCTQDYLAFLIGSDVSIYNTDGAVVGSVEGIKSGTEIVMGQAYVYILENSEIVSYSAFGEAQQDEDELVSGVQEIEIDE